MKQNKNKYFKFIFLILGLGSFIFTQDNIVDLTIANVDEQYGTFDVLYNSQEDIYSFQINIEGVTLIDVASDLFGMTSFNSETGTIIGLNISQDPAATAGSRRDSRGGPSPRPWPLQSPATPSSVDHIRH